MAVEVRPASSRRHFLSESQWTAQTAIGTLRSQETLTCRAVTQRPGVTQLAIVVIPRESPWRRAPVADIRLALGLDDNWEIISLVALPHWLPGVIDDLNGLAGLAPNWDSYGGEAVSSTVLRRAAELLLELIPLDGAEPSVVPLSYGGVQFEWHGDTTVEIQVGPEGNPEVWFRNANGEDGESALSDRSTYSRVTDLIRSAS